MSTKNRKLSKSEKRIHDRSVKMQWFALSLVICLTLIAVLVFTDGSGGSHFG